MKAILTLFILLITTQAFAAFSNHNSILLGEKAAGMGGAFTALIDDPSSIAFYNPATLSRVSGSSLSASVNLYAKSDIKYGDQTGFGSAPLRINQGSIIPIPSASGSVFTFGNFALGLSIMLPDFESFAGEVFSDTNTTSYLNLTDQTLWIGGALALNISDSDSVGITMYYTSRTFTRSISDKSGVTPTTLTTEDKSLTYNSIIYILGYYHEISKELTFGLSYRFPSLSITGKGSYFRNTIDTSGGTATTFEPELSASSPTPARAAVGFAYTKKNRWTLSFDTQLYGGISYDDLSNAQAADKIVHEPTWNFALGGEYYIKDWITLRSGFFTNYSSHKPILNNPTSRVGDYINMMGFSLNAGFKISKNTSMSFGGYYTGGKGHSVQQVAQVFKKIEKSKQIFSFLVGSTFYF